MARMHNRTVTTRPTEQSSGPLAAVLEGAGVGIVVLDARGHIVIANTAFYDLLGYAKEELLGLHERNITHDDADAALFRDLVAGRRARYTIDKRYLHKNGAEVWGRITVTVVHESAGDFAVAVVEDITEKRGIEEAADEVRRAHERYALVARATNDVIWDWDAEHGTIIWNDALQSMFGYAPDQIDNRLQWWDSHLHPDDRERVVAGINGIIEKGGSSWTDEYRFERADGSFTEVLDRGYIARSEDGTPIRMIGAMLDVTERKRAERTATFMAEASAVLASSLDYHITLARVAELTVPLLADCCFVDLRTGEETFERLASAAQDGARDLFAGLVREVITTGVPRLLAHIDSTDPLHASGIGSALIVPLVVVSGDRPMGALTLAMSHSRRVLAERDTRVVEDVARRAAMAIEHARLYDDAQKANLAKDEFLAILSHELSTRSSSAGRAFSAATTSHRKS
jgi:PAS domain S-box-containing protein